MAKKHRETSPLQANLFAPASLPSPMGSSATLEPQAGEAIPAPVRQEPKMLNAPPLIPHCPKCGREGQRSVRFSAAQGIRYYCPVCTGEEDNLYFT